jgi:hypothetical protein
MSSMHANSCLNECTYILLINSINFIDGCYGNFMSNWVTFTVYYDQIYLVLTSSSLLFGSAPFSINNSTIWVSTLDTATWSGFFPCGLKIHTYIQIYLYKVVPIYLITYFIGHMIKYEKICDFFYYFYIYIYLSQVKNDLLEY